MSKSYIIDTKIFVSFMLSIDPSCENVFETCVRDSNIDKERFEKFAKLLQKEIESHRIILYITPQILAEFSNWMKKYVKGEKYNKLMKKVINFLKESGSEHYVEMDNILQEEKILIKFGFTDASIYLCSKDLNNDRNVTLITSDRELYGLCSNKNIDTILCKDRIYTTNPKNLRSYVDFC